MKYLFIDTNFFMHYKSFETVLWAKEFNSEKVTIVIESVILKELDKHKDNHRIGKIKKRIIEILKKIESHFEDDTDGGKEIAPGIRMLFLENYSKIDFSKYGLSKESNDDVFLGSILTFKEENECDPRSPL